MMNSILRISAFAFCASIFLHSAARSQDFGLPVDCAAAGINCQIQQYVDMDTGKGEHDPFCGIATYDGHQGTDIRVASMRDVIKGVPVLAMADGLVLRGRDGEQDRLMFSAADRAAVANKECGNGLVLDFGQYEVQYCHLRQGSVAVKAGDKVKTGQKIAEIGASGMAQFPHLHITVRRNGSVVDPMTGATPSAEAACLTGSGQGNSLWSATARESLRQMAGPLIAAGIAGNPPVHHLLSSDGAPPNAKSDDKATVGWAWFANLQKGDRIRLLVRAPDGSVFSENQSDPLDRNKSDYSAFSGRKRPPVSGEWVLEIGLMRAGRIIFEDRKTVLVQ